MASLKRHSKKNSTMQFRVNSEDRFTIQRAAMLRGLEPSVYIRSLILDHAKREIKESEDSSRIILSAEEWDKFIEIMNTPFKMNNKLKKMFSDYKEKYGEFKNPAIS